MSKFKREHDRYLVIKVKGCHPLWVEQVRSDLSARGADLVECVVVESDWPIYQETWDNVQRMAEGRRSIGEELAKAEQAANHWTQVAIKHKERAEALTAHVERIIREWNSGDDQFSDEWINRTDDIVEDAPETSLARRDLLKQAEGVEKAAEQISLAGDPDTVRARLLSRANKLRRQAKGEQS